MTWLVWQFQDEFALALLLTALLLALARGAAAERVMALALFAQVPYFIVAGLLTGTNDPHSSYRGIEADIFLADCLSLALYVIIALRANRVYPLIIAGAQLIAVMAHFVRGVSAGLVPRAYAALILAPLHLQLATLLIGVLLHMRRQSRIGPYPSWRSGTKLPGRT